MAEFSEFNPQSVDYTDPENMVSTDGFKDSDEVIKAKVDEEFEQMLSIFRDTLDPKADVVYYPNCADDITPQRSFPDSRVIFVEEDQDYVDQLTSADVEVHAADPTEFVPDTDVDILVLHNTKYPPQKFAGSLHDNGYVVSNNYYETADVLRIDPEFALQAVVRKQGDAYVYDDEDLDNYFKEVETEEEFKEAVADSSMASYAVLQSDHDIPDGQVLSTYKSMIATARSNQNENKEPDAAVDRNPFFSDFFLGEVMNETENGQMVIYTDPDGNSHALRTRLPRKKGSGDDLFIYRKKHLVKQGEK